VGITPLSVSTAANSVLNPEAALDQLDLGFTPVGDTFKVQNGSFVLNTVNLATQEVSAHTIDIDLDGVNPDTVMDDPVNNKGLIQLINSSPAGQVVQAQLDSQGRFVIASRDADTYGFFFGPDTSGVLAALGMNAFFTGHDAATFDVASGIVANNERIATGSDLAPGNNEVANALAAFRETDVFVHGTRNLDDFYEGVVARLAGEAGLAFDRQLTREGLLGRLENEREQLSGVSLDEELAKLVQFQRSFQAAARFINTIDVILETLVNL